MKKPLQVVPTTLIPKEDENLVAKPPPKTPRKPVTEKSSGGGLAIAVIGVVLAVAVAAFVMFHGGGSGGTMSELQSREATDCFCTDAIPPSFTTAVFSTHRRPRNLGFAVFGTNAEVIEFANKIAACREGGVVTLLSSNTDMSQWDGAAFTTAVTSPSRCRVVVLMNINSIPSATRTNFKSLLDHNFWDGVYTLGHLTVLLRFPSLGRGVPKEEHYQRAFEDVQSRKVLDDRVLHLLGHVVLS